MKAKIKINGREIVIENIRRVSWLGKYIGLMFRRNSPALLFEFKKGKKGIHSIFCRPFIAVWLLENKVQEYKIIDSWQGYISPEKDFDMLLEIPLNEKYKHLLGNFADKTDFK